MILVVGGGFGLYGHVAALAGSGRDVATLGRYRAHAEARPELADLLPRIRWVDDVMTAARDAEAVVLAQTPGQNAALARAILGSANRSPELVEGCGSGEGPLLIIEKPVAETPAAAAVLEAVLAAAGRRWAVPYLFAECDWATGAATALTQGKSVEIDWAHRQSPMVRGWKREADAGGGAIAFYFIHCLALAETLVPGRQPTLEVAHDANGAVTACSLSVAASEPGPKLRMCFSLGGEAQFSVRIDDIAVTEMATPFGPIPAAGSADPRLPMLAAFHQRVAEDPAFQPPAFHAAVTRHWAALEAVAHG